MKKIWIALIIIAVIILGIFAIYKTPELCELTGGRWGRHSFGDPIEYCISPSPDAGKLCTDSSQCVSSCVASDGELPGKCYEWFPLPSGCYAFVEDGETWYLCSD